MLLLAAFAAGQVIPGAFSPATPPFTSGLGAGVQVLSDLQIKVDTNLDGIPDTIVNLPAEIQGSPSGAYTINYLLSPTEQILYTEKDPGLSPLPGCGLTDVRVFFHQFPNPPAIGMTPTPLNPGGTCMPGPLSAGPLFNDLTKVARIRTGIVVGAAAPVPSQTPVLWVDLFSGGSNKDTLNYDSNVEPTIGGIQFAPGGDAAYIQHGSNTAFPKWALIDLCASPIAAAGSVSIGALPAGTPSAWVIPAALPGTFEAEVHVDDNPIVLSRVLLNNCSTAPPPPGPPTILVVNDAGDAVHACATTGSGTCTLRDVLTYANTTRGAIINFNIAGGGVHTISPGTSLPQVNVSVTIDGYTQPGASPNTNGPGLPDNAVILIEISGTPFIGGLHFNAGNNVIRGLAINGWGVGLLMNGGSGGSVIAGNFIGTDPTGTISKQNNVGINGASAPFLIVGGRYPADRNVISGNFGGAVSVGGNGVVQGNFIGVDATGAVGLGNGGGVGCPANGCLIGGTTAAQGNVITANYAAAVLSGSNNVISGNIIGLDLTGSFGIVPVTAATGIAVTAGNNNRVGGTSGTTPGGPCTGECNLISTKGGEILVGAPATNTIVQGNVIGLTASGTTATFASGGPNCISVNSATGTLIGGTTAAARNVIATCYNGVFVADSPSTTISGNFIGSDVTGLKTPGAIVPISTGITITNDAGKNSNNSVFGGTTAVSAYSPCSGACNVIVGAQYGIWIGDNDSNLNVQGNRIGVGVDGQTILPNNLGIRVVQTTPGSVNGIVIGGPTALAGNIISGNTTYGVEIDGGTGTLVQNNTISGNGMSSGDGIFLAGGAGTQVTQNSIFGSGRLGIDLPPLGIVEVDDPCDADGHQNYPVITAASSSGGSTTIAGTLNSTASTTFNLDFFSTPVCNALGHGEGKTYLGSTSVMTNASCTAAFNAVLPVSVTLGAVITCTATSAALGTSEFSQCHSLIGGCPATTLSPSVLPGATEGLAYNQIVTASGGVFPYSFSVSGTLPAGLGLASSGGFFGAPTQTGTFYLAITATDANGCITTQATSLTVACAGVGVTPGTLPAGAFDVAYNQVLSISGGSFPPSFHLAVGPLPQGLTLSPSGILSGTPTQSGTFNIVVTGTDAAGCSASQAYTLTIAPPAPAPRVFVSALHGSDTNPCSLKLPCRGVATALSLALPGGEVVILDSGGYGGFTVSRSATITAASGVYAGISGFSGDAIAIEAGPTDVVSLGNLTVNGLGGTTGIHFVSGGTLQVESCQISGFETGILSESDGTLAVSRTTIRGSSGPGLSVAPLSPSSVTLSACQLEDNDTGASLAGGSALLLSESVVAGNTTSGVTAVSGTVDLEDCLIAGNGVGVSVTGTAISRVSDSIITDNGTGLSQSGGAALLSRFNNTIEGNTTDISGTVNPYTPK
jgi:parallel beta-helix repeat protein